MKEEKTRYEEPEIEIFQFSTEDIITTSGQDPRDDPDVDPEGWVP